MWHDHYIGVIWGQPYPMPRPRFNTRTGRAYNTEEAKKQKRKISAAISLGMREQNITTVSPLYPIRIELCFVHRRPKRLKYAEKREYRPKKPDIDNLCKTYMDSCSSAHMWIDDNQVVSLVANDYYASSIEDPKTIIKISYYKQ